MPRCSRLASIASYGAVGPGKAAELGIERLFADLGMDAIGERAPAGGALGLAVGLGNNLDGAVAKAT